MSWFCKHLWLEEGRQLLETRYSASPLLKLFGRDFHYYGGPTTLIAYICSKCGATTEGERRGHWPAKGSE